MRTLIPVSDPILRVSNEYGVFGQIKDERLIAQSLLGFGACGDVHRNAQETHDCPIRIVRGSHRHIDRQRLAIFPNKGPFPFLMLAVTGLLDKDIEALHRLAYFLCQLPTPARVLRIPNE